MRINGGCTGITHVFIGPTGPVDHQFLGNVHRSAEFRGQSLMSGETLDWLRRHHGVVHTHQLERERYVMPPEYIEWLDSFGAWRSGK